MGIHSSTAQQWRGKNGEMLVFVSACARAVRVCSVHAQWHSMVLGDWPGASSGGDGPKTTVSWLCLDLFSHTSKLLMRKRMTWYCFREGKVPTKPPLRKHSHSSHQQRHGKCRPPKPRLLRCRKAVGCSSQLPWYPPSINLWTPSNPCLISTSPLLAVRFRQRQAAHRPGIFSKCRLFDCPDHCCMYTMYIRRL